MTEQDTPTATPDCAGRGVSVIETARARAVAAWAELGSPRLGMRGYLCVLGYLTVAPATTIDVAAAFGTGRQYARELIQRMGELGLVHTVGSVRTGRAGPPVLLWAAGPGPIDRSGAPSRDRFPELMQLARILAALEEPMRAKELAHLVGSGEQLVRELLRIGRRLELMHVCVWDPPTDPRGSGRWVACWVRGKGWDARRPRPVGNIEAKRRHRSAEASRRQMIQVLSAMAGGVAA